MKAAICALTVLVILTAGAFWNSHFLSTRAGELSEQTEAILPLAKQEEDCTEAINALHEAWDACSFFFMLTINHAEFDRLEEELERATAAAEIENSDELYLAASALADMFRHIEHLSGIRAENIL